MECSFIIDLLRWDVVALCLCSSWFIMQSIVDYDEIFRLLLAKTRSFYAYQNQWTVITIPSYSLNFRSDLFLVDHTDGSSYYLLDILHGYIAQVPGTRRDTINLSSYQAYPSGWGSAPNMGQPAYDSKGIRYCQGANQYLIRRFIKHTKVT